MTANTFEQRLAHQQAEWRRQQAYRAWTLVAGLLSSVGCAVLTAPLLTMDFTGRPDQVLFALLSLAGWTGALSLIAYGVIGEGSPAMTRTLLAGLWVGAVALAAVVPMAPLAVLLVLLPLGTGAAVVGRLAGRRWAGLYLALPALSLLAGALWQAIR